MPALPTSRDLALRAVLRVLRPLVRLLVREGVTYPALAAALKPVFVDAARAELRRQGAKETASALTLSSGVHRKDLRAMADAPLVSADQHGADTARRLDIVGQVVAVWLSARGWQARGRPRVLPRSGSERSFDALVATVSQDVRARAVLDEMLRLGVVSEADDGIALVADGMAPRQGFDAMSEALAVNLQDHAAAAVANLQGAAHLDQAVYADEIGEASVEHLRRAAREAWQVALASITTTALERLDHDQRKLTPDQRRQRFRFGAYAFDDRMDDRTDERMDE